jgi:hypothetical protein
LTDDCPLFSHPKSIKVQRNKTVNKQFDESTIVDCRLPETSLAMSLIFCFQQMQGFFGGNCDPVHTPRVISFTGATGLKLSAASCGEWRAGGFISPSRFGVGQKSKSSSGKI